jgi:hypothetical protein
MADEPTVEENVPVEFNVRTTYSTVGSSLQKGSRYSFGPVPTAVEFEIVYVNEDEWIVWVFHTPGGVQRYAMPKPTVEESWRRLGRALGASDPKIEIARQMPDGHHPHPQQG